MIKKLTIADLVTPEAVQRVRLKEYEEKARVSILNRRIKDEMAIAKRYRHIGRNNY